jgi:hypothetical protein
VRLSGDGKGEGEGVFVSMHLAVHGVSKAVDPEQVLQDVGMTRPVQKELARLRVSPDEPSAEIQQVLLAGGGAVESVPTH